MWRRFAGALVRPILCNRENGPRLTPGSLIRENTMTPVEIVTPILLIIVCIELWVVVVKLDGIAKKR